MFRMSESGVIIGHGKWDYPKTRLFGFLNKKSLVTGWSWAVTIHAMNTFIW